ncbi:MAG: hypothetical protein KAF64_20035, partial [Hydrogenophaga sp.]|uniref:hypothetical protein n=1 Tax=Hydrogenophaga sp. TaxID=1904254 RepID=UPI0025BE7202
RSGSLYDRSTSRWGTRMTDSPSLQLLEHWLRLSTEYENLEFKEAKQQYDSQKLMRYCVAIANEGAAISCWA